MNSSLRNRRTIQSSIERRLLLVARVVSSESMVRPTRNRPQAMGCQGSVNRVATVTSRSYRYFVRSLKIVLACPSSKVAIDPFFALNSGLVIGNSLFTVASCSL